MSQEERPKRKSRELGAFYLDGDGVVIDHLEVGSGEDVVEILDVEEVNLSKGYPSTKHVRKDRVVVSKNDFEMTELLDIRIALRSPRNTISIRKKGEIEKKYCARIPDVVKGQVRCPTLNCITNSKGEGAPMKMYHTEEDGTHMFTCHYCETKFDHATVLREKLLTYLD